MPRRGFKHLSVREDLYERLVALRDRLGFGSLGDVIAYLLAVEEHASRRGLEEAVAEAVRRCSGAVQAPSAPAGLGKVEAELSVLSARVSMLARKVRELDEAVRRIGLR